MKIKHFVTILTFVLVWSCKQPLYQSARIEGKQINISDSLAVNKGIEEFVKPYREHINKSLDSVISYAPAALSKSDGEYNTAIGNMMADAILEQADPVFYKRTGKNIDMVLFNHGGIRSIISKGNITSRTAYEVMPFENTIVVVELQGKQIKEMCEYLRESNRAHPISGLQLTLNNDMTINNASIQGSKIVDNQTYYVATSNYLVNGGDSMRFFGKATKLVETDYLIRNALIDYFKKKDTIAPVRDDRFIKLD